DMSRRSTRGCIPGGAPRARATPTKITNSNFIATRPRYLIAYKKFSLYFRTNSCLGTNPCPSQPPQILLPLPHIPPDLLSQRIDRRKLDLIPQTIQKMKFDFRFRRKLEWMEIQQVRFDGKGISAEGGAV